MLGVLTFLIIIFLFSLFTLDRQKKKETTESEEKSTQVKGKQYIFLIAVFISVP